MPFLITVYLDWWWSRNMLSRVWVFSSWVGKGDVEYTVDFDIGWKLQEVG